MYVPVQVLTIDVPIVFCYSGEYWDSDTGLQYLRTRWYDPNAARFFSRDTYEGQMSNPLRLNLYSYVENNPLKYTNPSGHIPKWVESSWNKTSTFVYNRANEFTYGSLSNYLEVANRNPYSVEQFLSAADLALYIVPAYSTEKMGLEGGKQTVKATSKIVNKGRGNALRKADPNKLNHIIGKSEHNLGDFLKE